ncbi:MAG: hypothetical protein EOO28_25510 [Comamonadaceae bacterium]|nr:MAG: hypothetical protein EOO28_25510 [Comamonadaceae bacterium]
MNQSLEALMGSMRRALEGEIQPELQSDHARSQLAGVLDVLRKIESMVVWSPDVTREQLEVLEVCLAQAAAMVAAHIRPLVGDAAPEVTSYASRDAKVEGMCHPGLDPGSTVARNDAVSTLPWIPDQVRDDSVPVPLALIPLTQADLESALADAERRFAILTDWLFAPPADLPASLKQDLHDLLGTTLRNTLKAQRRLVPSADFSSMTAPRSSAGAQGDTP